MASRNITVAIECKDLDQFKSMVAELERYKKALLIAAKDYTEENTVSWDDGAIQETIERWLKEADDE